MDNENSEGVIRDYLLGRLDANDEVSSRIDERAIMDSEFSEQLEVIEDEIIEDYLEGNLSAKDREACESHFLRPPERQRRLRSARLLVLHLADPGNVYDPKEVRRETPLNKSLLKFRVYRGYLEVAAGILFVASLVYLVRQHRELTEALDEQRQQLLQQGKESAQLNSPLDVLHKPSVKATLNLLEPGTLRGDTHLPTLRSGLSGQTIQTQVALPPGVTGIFALEILCDEKTVWSQGPMISKTIKEGAVLSFDFPGQVLREGDCKLELRRVSHDVISYPFVVLRKR